MALLKKFREYVQDARADDTEMWMLPYSTLMLMLVILFIVFYGYSAFNSVEYEAAIADLASTKPGSPNGENLRKEIALARGMQEFINEKQLSEKAEVKMTAHYIRLKMESPALFDSGSAALKFDSFPLLDQMSGQLKTMENHVIVEGHTDNVPIHSEQYNSNWELSASRAFSVIHYFIQKGIGPKRLAAHGFGEFRPAFPNDEEIGRAKNRRIEITVIRTGTGA
ncbi:MAG: flagellar motor protein MotB [bacterium]